MDPNLKLKILVLEDQKEDVILIKRELQKSGLNFLLTGVDEKNDYIDCLNNFKPHIILSDHSLPQFNSLEALQICRKKKPDIPFILVTGTVSEEFAAQCIKNGADDYVLKSNIKRLSTSIKQALRHREDEKKRIEAERMILDQNSELIKINSELDTFVYNISHNLRAPLLSLLGLIYLAKKDTDELHSNILSEYLERIDLSAHKLDKTLCEILDYSRNARGELIYEKLDLKNIFAEEYLKIMHLEKSNSLDYQIKIDQNVEFASDAYRISVIVNNLISNAVKYQDKSKNSKRIEVRGEVSERSAELFIADNGVGIDPAHVGDIFKMFFRASTLSVGSGLGLYIVKETLDKLKGKIDVTSELDKGTAFHLSIPNKIKDMISATIN
jgi:hypothetical protein